MKLREKEGGGGGGGSHNLTYVFILVLGKSNGLVTGYRPLNSVLRERSN